MSKFRKTTCYSYKYTDSKRRSLHTRKNYNDGRKRRKARDRGLAFKCASKEPSQVSNLSKLITALQIYESRIKHKGDLYISRVSHEEAVDATDRLMYLGFDII